MFRRTTNPEPGRYMPPAEPPRGVMRLHCNEGARPPADFDQGVELSALSRQYPDVAELRCELAARLGRPESEVLLTAGADGVLDRVMRAFAGAGRTVVVPDPTFEMIPTYARQTGATVIRVPWVNEFPTEALIRDSGNAAVVALVTPDNPTGRTIPWDVVERVARALPEAVILLDHAYVEYADDDYTQPARALQNVVVARTLSKAWGLAGLRVGYAVGTSEMIERLAAVSSPYPVSALSAAIALRCVRNADYVDDHVRVVRAEREQLASTLDGLGAVVTPSRANFVFARFERASFVRDGLAALGIEVRSLTDRAGLGDALRIGCPGDAADYERLEAALQTVMRPEALIFDMDGVLADVRESYREAIVQTCREFGVDVTPADVALQKLRPDSNDDFAVTQRLLLERGVDASLALVTESFQRRYDAGLWRREPLLIDRSLLQQVRERHRLAVVTGRPRGDAQRFLDAQELAPFFDAVICREDAPLKPDPAPVRLAMQELGCRTAWMFGDTVDDITAALGASVLACGVTAPGEDTQTTRDTLRAAGAAATVSNIDEAMQWLI